MCCGPWTHNNGQFHQLDEEYSVAFYTNEVVHIKFQSSCSKCKKIILSS